MTPDTPTPESTTLGTMIAAGRPDGDSVDYVITHDWMQGRTTYGGLSAGLCLAGVLACHPDLPPLRSAQIAFIGPAGGNVTVRPRLLRKGRSMVFVEADLHAGETLAARALFAFGTPRESEIALDRFAMPSVPAPGA